LIIRMLGEENKSWKTLYNCLQNPIISSFLGANSSSSRLPSAYVRARVSLP
jgi:hypothetical protein